MDVNTGYGQPALPVIITSAERRGTNGRLEWRQSAKPKKKSGLRGTYEDEVPNMHTWRGVVWCGLWIDPLKAGF